MKLLLPIIFLLFFVQCTQKQTTDQELNNKIQVAVFDGHGGAQTCIWETVAAVKLDTDMSVRTITTADIANNVLDSLDAIIIPGGGGSRQFLNLSALNQQRIKDFVASGGGIVGICAGAYLLSNTPDYACMQLNGAQAIDIEHDNRGHGISKFTLTDEGKKIFPEIAKRDTLFVMYYEGPVFIKKENDTISYETLAIMESDVHEEGNAPKNMTNNKPFFITNSYGKGRIFSSIAHPEATPGMMWMIPRMVRWTLNIPIKEYKSEVVNPDIFNREILMSISDLKQESASQSNRFIIFYLRSAGSDFSLGTINYFSCNDLPWFPLFYQWNNKTVLLLPFGTHRGDSSDNRSLSGQRGHRGVDTGGGHHPIGIGTNISRKNKNGIRSHMEIHFPLLGGNCLRLYGYPFHRLWH
jgi:glutamine amidotransferase-like uncharacterized protein